MDTPVTPSITPSPSDEESLKKYIRTYAGDMEIVKKGGTPDLKPLESAPSAPFGGTQETIPFTPSPPSPEPVVETPVAPPPPIEIPVPPPPPPPPPPAPLIVDIPPPVLAEPAPPPQIRPAPPVQFPEPTIVNAPEINASPLETYASDFLDKVKDTRASTATVLAAEEDAGTVPEKPVKKSSGWTIFAVIAGLFLLLVGGGGAYIGYTHYLVKTAPVVLAPTVSAPIFVDDKEQISEGTPADILNAITQSMARPSAPNTVRLLYTANATTTGSDLFSALGLPAPSILLRNIYAPLSMAGIVNISGTVSPFFILSVASYEDTFAGMLSWEQTMPSDLSALFPPYPSPSVSTAATTTATTTPKSGAKAKAATSTAPAPIFIPFFHDEVVGNHDVRVYRDASGQSVVIYGYWDKKTLVIARDPSAFTEILRRLSTSSTQ